MSSFDAAPVAFSSAAPAAAICRLRSFCAAIFGCRAAKPYFFSTSRAKLMETLFLPQRGKVSQMLAPVGSAFAVPFAPTAAGPKGVPDRSPLPMGSGGGCSLARAGFVGGVGAAEFDALPESDFFSGAVLRAVSFSESISMALLVLMACTGFGGSGALNVGFARLFA